MAWASSAVLDADFASALARLVDEVSRGLAGAPADLAFLFVGREHRERHAEALAAVRERLGRPVTIGCAAGGVIGGGREHEDAPALSLLAGSAPGTAVHPFRVEDSDLPDADAGPAAWHALLGVPPAAGPSFVVVADPTTIRADALLSGLDFAYPAATKVGGLASGGDEPFTHVLFAGDRAVRSGAVGVALTGALAVDPAVAQGCRAIGPVSKVTSCEGHLLRELDGAPAVSALRAALAQASERDRALARHSLFLGFETDPFATGDDGTWLIRNLVGADRAGGLYVGEALRPGRRVRFHVRDRTTSAEDLERTLERAASGGRPEAALLFSCTGRGTPLYGAPDHDSRAFRARFGDVPLAGFFCHGEIGPVGGATHLHGYTSSFGLLRPRDGNA